VRATLDAHDPRRFGNRCDGDDLGPNVVEAHVEGGLDPHERVVATRGPEVDDAAATGIDDGDLSGALEAPVARSRVDPRAGERDFISRADPEHLAITSR
jgi:hypothetical protein